MTKCLQTWLAPFAVDAVKMQVTDVRIDSREVCPGDVFVATVGVNQDGVKFIDNAIAAGAVAVLLDSRVQIADKAVPVYAIKDLPDVLPVLLGRFYDTEKVKLIGVTGTNGKTTISQLIAQLGQQIATKVAVVGTLGAGPLDNLVEMNNTTPGIANNYRLLEQFAEQGCQFVAMEVSSQGLDQGRVAGLGFDTAVFTNLTQDHLDYHGTMDSYAAAKKILFEQNPDAAKILNIDDSTGQNWYQLWQGDETVIAVGAYDEKYADVKHVMFDEVQYGTSGLSFCLKSYWGSAKVSCPLFGRFNLYNLVSSMAVYLNQGVALEKLVAAAGHIQAVPGRMERFGNGSIAAIVDYAHTPDALAQALKAVKDHVSGRLWCIFGCGGDRDTGKRPLMGQMASRYADEVVVTNDNPRHETPQQIAEQILAGMDEPEKVVVQLDRKQAILDTFARAKAGDIVLIAGKGHESYQIFGDDIIEYDERRFVGQYFAQNFEELAS